MRCLSTILLLIWGISLSAQNNHISIGFFPEGGKLITGESCVIGFKATTAKGEPLAIRCKIVDNKKTSTEKPLHFMKEEDLLKSYPKRDTNTF